MYQLDQYQIKLLQQNIDSTKKLIKENQQQLKTLQNVTMKCFLQQQISCLKQNVKNLQESIKQKKLKE